MKTLSFRGRLTLRWTASFGLLLALTNGAIYVVSHTLTYQDLDAGVRTIAGTELASAFDSVRIHLHDVPTAALSADEHAVKVAQILSEDGQVLVSSGPAAGRGPIIGRETIASALAGQAPTVTLEVPGGTARVAAMAGTYEGRRYVLVAGVLTTGLERNLARLAWLLTIVWFAGSALTGVLGFVLASRALAPIDQITARAATIARGDFSARLDPPLAHDEIGRMTTLLNEMLERLHGAIEANRRFAADAAHELRSPLTSMRGEIDVALKRDRSAGEYRETLLLVRERLGDLAQLTESLMLLVRAQEGSEVTLTEVALVPLLRASAGRVASAARLRQVEIRFERLPDLIAYADPRLLARAFDNLLLNATQFNRDGGSVVVTGGVEEPGSTDAWTTGHAVVRVRDTGFGIPAHEAERVFDRFHRVDTSRSRRTGGSGLGLSICKEVVRLFNGTIRIAASSESGTEMEIRLPGRCASAELADGVLVPAGQSVAHVYGVARSAGAATTAGGEL